ncbi:MAG: hypothetical protein ACRDV4_11075, partial [Acidimicrobiales bacterium]
MERTEVLGGMDAEEAVEGSLGQVQKEAQPHSVLGHPGSILHLPSPKAFVRHALPSLIEGTIGPAAIFYIVLVAAGFKGAIIAALCWSYLAFARRIL